MRVWLQVSLLLVTEKLEMLEAPSPLGAEGGGRLGSSRLHHTSRRGPRQRGPSRGTTGLVVHRTVA